MYEPRIQIDLGENVGDELGGGFICFIAFPEDEIYEVFVMYGLAALTQET